MKLILFLLLGACADGSEVNSEWKNSVLNAAETLVTAIKKSPSPLPLPDQNVKDILLKWLQPVSIFQIYDYLIVFNIGIFTLK